MGTYFFHSIEQLIYPATSRPADQAGLATVTNLELAQESPRIQLEIKAETLKRIMTHDRLAIEDVRCLNAHSKAIIRQILLDNMVNRTRSAAQF